MTQQFKQLVLFYVVLSALLFVMTLSLTQFPYIEEAKRMEYLHLSHSVLLIAVPFAFIVSMFRMASK